MPGKALAGCTIVVTRPGSRASTLLVRLADEGADAVHFPTISIDPPDVPLSIDALRPDVNQCDIVIFISPNAVSYGLPVIGQAGGLSDNTRIAAVGRSTAEELARHDKPADYVPESGASSEALLDVLAAEDVAGQKILIFRGNGGRELLAETLRARGAHVRYIECYRRGLADTDPDILAKLWSGNGIDALIVSSADGLRNLHSLVNAADHDRLRATPVYVVSPAMVELCGNLGYNSIILMDSPRDDDVLSALRKQCRPGQ